MLGEIVNQGGILNLVDDVTPQLGGDLDVNGNSIVSASDGNIPITPNGTGSVILDGLNWPQADGVADDYLKTDGSAQLAFGPRWTDVAFNAAHFTGGGSQTWTVAAGDVESWKYFILGKVMTVSLTLLTTTVGGTPDSSLNVLIPDSYTSHNQSGAAGWGADNGTFLGMRIGTNTDDSATNLGIFKLDASNWAASTDNTRVEFTITFEIN